MTTLPYYASISASRIRKAFTLVYVHSPEGATSSTAHDPK